MQHPTAAQVQWHKEKLEMFESHPGQTHLWSIAIVDTVYVVKPKEKTLTLVATKDEEYHQFTIEAIKKLGWKMLETEKSLRS